MRVFEPLRYMHVDGLSPRIVMYIFVAGEWLHSSSHDKTFIVVADKLGFILLFIQCTCTFKIKIIYEWVCTYIDVHVCFCGIVWLNGVSYVYLTKMMPSKLYISYKATLDMYGFFPAKLPLRSNSSTANRTQKNTISL